MPRAAANNPFPRFLDPNLSIAFLIATPLRPQVQSQAMFAGFHDLYRRTVPREKTIALRRYPIAVKLTLCSRWIKVDFFDVQD
jgi:hypothetical protein